MCVRALLDSAGQVLCSAAATLVLFLFYVFGDMMEQLVFSDCSPIVGWAIVQDEHSGIKTGRVINDKHILQACSDYNKSIVAAVGAPQIITMCRAAAQACAFVTHSAVAHPCHILQQTYARRFLQDLTKIATAMGATPVKPSFDLLTIVPPPDPDMIRKVRMLILRSSFMLDVLCFLFLCTEW